MLVSAGATGGALILGITGGQEKWSRGGAAYPPCWGVWPDTEALMSVLPKWLVQKLAKVSWYTGSLVPLLQEKGMSVPFSRDSSRACLVPVGCSGSLLGIAVPPEHKQHRIGPTSCCNSHPFP